ncbi:MAG: ABC transporter substrate-binding protein, partial [Patescibacteria group bacterium]
LSPVGSGPYQFESYDKESDGFITLYRLRANLNYLPGPAFIKKFDFRFFRKTEELTLAFSSGQVDGFITLRTDELGGLKRPHQVIKFSLPSYYAVFLNQSRNLSLKELEVRKALALTAPKEKIIQEIFEGEAEALSGPIPKGAAYFDPEAPEDPVSTSSLSQVQFAVDILEEGLWQKSSSSNFRSKKIKNSEIELGFNLVVPQIPFLLKTANILKSAWEEIGFKINLVVLSPEEIVETVIKNRDYEALLFGNVLNENSDLFSFWHSSGRFSPGLNLSLYNNKKADELIEAIRQNLDPEKRKNQFSELQKIITLDYPAVFLYSPNYLYITKKGLMGPTSGSIAESANRLNQVSNWYLKTVRVFK